MSKRIDELRDQIAELNKQLQAEELLRDIWIELCYRTPVLTDAIRNRLQNHFELDNQE